MIGEKDRSGWFGASDASMIVGNWETKTFESWWLTKLGISSHHFSNDAMMAGTHKEHQILEQIDPEMETDRQILVPELRLRVNLDGNQGRRIHEVKTYCFDKGFKPSKAYIRQVNVQMFALDTTEAEIDAYGLLPEDYDNFYLPIDPHRLSQHPVEYDDRWIEEVFLPRLRVLCSCLEEGRFPVWLK